MPYKWHFPYPQWIFTTPEVLLSRTIIDITAVSNQNILFPSTIGLQCPVPWPRPVNLAIYSNSSYFLCVAAQLCNFMSKGLAPGVIATGMFVLWIAFTITSVYLCWWKMSFGSFANHSMALDEQELGLHLSPCPLSFSWSNFFFVAANYQHHLYWQPFSASQAQGSIEQKAKNQLTPINSIIS